MVGSSTVSEASFETCLKVAAAWLAARDATRVEKVGFCRSAIVCLGYDGCSKDQLNQPLGIERVKLWNRNQLPITNLGGPNDDLVWCRSIFGSANGVDAFQRVGKCFNYHGRITALAYFNNI